MDVGRPVPMKWAPDLEPVDSLCLCDGADFDVIAEVADSLRRLGCDFRRVAACEPFRTEILKQVPSRSM
jgi:hypothetical protein